MAKVAQIKTKETEASVEDFIRSIADETKQEDSFALLKIMEQVSKTKGKMWGNAIIGFGNKRFKSPASGREVDWFLVGFAPRKATLTLYLFLDAKRREELLSKLGKHKTDGGCIYIKKLADVDLKVLKQLVQEGMKIK